jgi:anti-sigma B factor antagonist
MFEITRRADGSIRLHGRFDAAQVAAAREVLNLVEDSCVVDFAELGYISSAGLGLLFATQKRLVDRGCTLTLANLNPHIREVFRIAGFDTIFEIDESGG